MREAGLSRGFLCAALMLTASLARAEDAATPPDNVVMLPCDGKCVTVTRNPYKIKGDKPQFPASIWREDYGSDAFVELQYIIAADGHVEDEVNVINLIGPREFAEAAKSAVRSYLYQPAMVDGKPVPISHSVFFVFSLTDGPESARPSIAQAYSKAVDLARQGKLDEAGAVLDESFKQPKLLFYERGLLLNLQALIALKEKNYVRARELTKLAAAFPAENMPLDVVLSIYRSNIIASLNVGDLGSAETSLVAMSKMRGFDPNDPLAKQVLAIGKKAAGLASVSSQAVIPAESLADSYRFALYKRNFTFTNVKGTLQSFTLNCGDLETQSAISLKAEWAVPKNWSGCDLYIKGTPGTTFDIVQFAAAQPSAPQGQ